MKLSIRRMLAVVGILAVAASVRSVVIVDQAETAFVTAFGRPVRLIEQAGLHFKWPHEGVRTFDRRLQLDTPPSREMLTKDKKNLEVAWYANWRISDVPKFRVPRRTTVRRVGQARGHGRRRVSRRARSSGNKGGLSHSENARPSM